MPVRRKRTSGRRRTRRRPSRKRRRRRKRLSYGFPKTYTCKLRYTEVITLDPTATSTPVHVFRCNSIYDPDYTDTGHQPAGFDQLAACYNYFSVKRADLRASVVGVGSGDASQAIGVQMGISATLPSNANTVADLVESKNELYNTWTTIREDNPTKTRSRRMTWTPSRSKKLAFWDNYSNTSATSGNPSRNDYFVVYATNNGLGTTNPAAVHLMVTIDYTVQFTGSTAIKSA